MPKPINFSSARDEAREQARIAADINPGMYEAADVDQRRGAQVLKPLVDQAIHEFMNDLCDQMENHSDMTVSDLAQQWNDYDENHAASGDAQGAMTFYEVMEVARGAWEKQEQRKHELWAAWRRGEIGWTPQGENDL